MRSKFDYADPREWGIRSNRVVYKLPMGWYHTDTPLALDVRGPFMSEAEATADAKKVDKK